MEKLPRYASELIEELDECIPYVEFPLTLEGIEDLSERKIRRMAFAAGARALIDDLKTLISEDEDGNGIDSVRGDLSDISGGVSVLSESTGEGTE